MKVLVSLLFGRLVVVVVVVTGVVVVVVVEWLVLVHRKLSKATWLPLFENTILSTSLKLQVSFCLLYLYIVKDFEYF